MQILNDLDRMLDRYEENGGKHFGLYRLARRITGIAGQDGRSAGGA